MIKLEPQDDTVRELSVAELEHVSGGQGSPIVTDSFNNNFRIGSQAWSLGATASTGGSSNSGFIVQF